MHIGGVYLQANAANSASIVLRRDSASGQIIFDMALNATSGGPMSRYVSFNPPLSMEETTTLHWALASGSGTSEAMIYEYVE